MHTVDYGHMSGSSEFFEKFDESRWLCKCGHLADRHVEDNGSGIICWDCDCKGLSNEPITVLELLNLRYGTDWDAHEYASKIPGEWSHTLESGPYNHTLVIRDTCSRDVYGYGNPLYEANYQFLNENWEDHPALTDGGYSDYYSIGLKWDAPAPYDLIETIESLEGYPCLDDELISMIENEWFDRDWQEYGLFDAMRELAKQLGIEDASEELDFEEMREALQNDIRYSDSECPFYESGGGTYFSYENMIKANLDRYRQILKEKG